MEAITILRELWRLRYLVFLGAMLASGHRADDGVPRLAGAAQAREPPVPRRRRLRARPRRHARLAGRRPQSQGRRRAELAGEPAGQPDGLEPREDDHRAGRRACRPASSSPIAPSATGPTDVPTPLSKAASESSSAAQTYILTLQADETLPIIAVVGPGARRRAGGAAGQRGDHGPARLPAVGGRRPERARRAPGRHLEPRRGPVGRRRQGTAAPLRHHRLRLHLRPRLLRRDHDLRHRPRLAASRRARALRRRGRTHSPRWRHPAPRPRSPCAGARGPGERPRAASAPRRPTSASRADARETLPMRPAALRPVASSFCPRLAAGVRADERG